MKTMVEVKDLVKAAALVKATTNRMDADRVCLIMDPNRLELRWAGRGMRFRHIIPSGGCETSEATISRTEFCANLKQWDKLAGECEIDITAIMEGGDITIGFVHEATKFRTAALNFEKTPLNAEIEPIMILDGDRIRGPLEKVLPCINPSDPRQAMTGVSIRVWSDRIMFAATNGIKLAEITIMANLDIPPDTKFILRHSTAAALVKILKANKGAQVFVGLGEANTITFVVGHTTMYARLIVDNYPDYNVMFDPKPQKVEIAIGDLDKLVKILKGSLDREDNNRLQLSIDDYQFRLGTDRSLSTINWGEASGVSMDKDINGEFLLDILGMLSGKTMVMSWRDDEPFIIFEPCAPTAFEKERCLVSCLKRR